MNNERKEALLAEIKALVKSAGRMPTWEELAILGYPRRTVRRLLGSLEQIKAMVYSPEEIKELRQRKMPKVLVLDIETAPLISYTWGLFDQNVGLEQIKQDWHLLSFAARWYGSPEDQIFYKDQRDAIDIEDDSELLKIVWSLIDEADIILTQNGVSFDMKKLNARFVLNGMKPPSSYKNIDTLQIAKKVFGFTSNKLAYMTDKLCTKYKKQSHREFSGFELWKECLAGNPKAWKAMEQYNKYDVLSLEELYNKLAAWDTSSINFSVYSNSTEFRCNCGSAEFKLNGYVYTKKSKFQRYICESCGKEHRDSKNLFDKTKRESLKV